MRQRAASVRAALLLAVLLWSLVACSLRGQDRSVPVPGGGVPAGEADPGPEGWVDVSIYLVAGSRLEAVTRPTPDPQPQAAIDLLLAGPSLEEVSAGLRTALSPQDLLVLEGFDDSGTAAVAVSREFTGIVGGNQLLAVAQVVWTVTQFQDVDRVRFYFDGEVVEVPTDQGLADGPVNRRDYRSVAPVAAGPGPPDATGPPAAPSSGPPSLWSGTEPGGPRRGQSG